MVDHTAKNSAGWATPVCLIVIALFSIIGLRLWHSAFRATVIGSLALEREIQTAASTAQIVRAAESFDALGLAAAGNIEPAACSFSSGPGLAPHISISVRQAARRLDVNQSINLALMKEPGFLPQPDWQNLQDLGVQRNCRIQEETTIGGDAPRMSSHRTCHDAPKTIASSVVVFGNLITGEMLSLAPSSSSLALVVLGDVEITDLSITGLVNKSVAIIAAGQIKIGRLSLDRNSDLTLLLHSSSAAVRLNSAPPELSSCRQSKIKGITFTVQQRSGYYVNNSLVSANRVFGCDYSDPALFWPQMRVLGQPLTQ